MKGEKFCKFVNLCTSQTYSFAILLRIVAASPTALHNSLKLSLEVYILAVLNAIWRWVATFWITGLVSTSFPLLWCRVICVHAIEQKYGGGIYITAANALSLPRQQNEEERKKREAEAAAKAEEEVEEEEEEEEDDDDWGDDVRSWGRWRDILFIVTSITARKSFTSVHVPYRTSDKGHSRIKESMTDKLGGPER